MRMYFSCDELLYSSVTHNNSLCFCLIFVQHTEQLRQANIRTEGAKALLSQNEETMRNMQATLQLNEGKKYIQIVPHTSHTRYICEISAFCVYPYIAL